MIFYYQKKYAYTINELRDYFEMGEVYENADTLTFQQILTKCNISVTFGASSKVATIFQKVMAKYNDEFYHVGCKVDEDNQQAIARKFLTKFLTIYFETNQYYEKLIDIYTAQESKLMNDIESSNIDKIMFNDTPQVISGVFEGESYATHFTKNEHTMKTPATTPIMRIKEIQDTYKRLYEDWTKEFERIVIENDLEVLCYD